MVMDGRKSMDMMSHWNVVDSGVGDMEIYG
jgi:hypothetical protein